MKVIFFGLGSIAKRHIKHLKALIPDVEIHAFRTVNNNPTPEGVEVVTRFGEVARNAYDIAFITNPSNLHIPYAIFSTVIGIPNIFVEKPLGVTTERLDQLLDQVEENGTATYVAYPLRCHPVIGSLKGDLADAKSVFILCSTNLHTWHPDGPSLYSMNAKTGGGAILELSHELDYVAAFMGLASSYRLGYCHNFGATKDAADNVLIKADHGGIDATYLLNLAGGITNREVWIDGVQRITFTVTDSIYHTQMEYFLSNLGNHNMINNVHEAAPLFRVLADLHKQSVERIRNQ